MGIILNSIELRVLGSLIEKGLTTPDYYPMTLNALTNACNQKSNRYPVVSFDETAVVRGLDSLQDKGLTEKIHKADSRVPKYRHSFDSKSDLSQREIAVLCVMMLRGPQTMGELRSRCERMYKFEDLQEVEKVLGGLMDREQPMVVKMPRRAGRKESRYMHMMAGKPVIDNMEKLLPEEPAAIQVRSENERIARLEEELLALRKDFDDFRDEYKSFKSQFD